MQQAAVANLLHFSVADLPLLKHASNPVSGKGMHDFGCHGGMQLDGFERKPAASLMDRLRTCLR